MGFLKILLKESVKEAKSIFREMSRTSLSGCKEVGRLVDSDDRVIFIAYYSHSRNVLLGSIPGVDEALCSYNPKKRRCYYMDGKRVWDKDLTRMFRDLWENKIQH